MFKKVLILLFLFSGCSNNVLNELSDKNSDAAILFDAQTYVNNQQYQSAIDVITTKLSASAKTSVEAREVLASAYAGKCGLNFVNYTAGLAAANSGSAFVLVSKPFVGVVVDPASCLLSLQTLDLIGTTANRTTHQNSFAAIVGMVLMGSAIRHYTDEIPANGDGVQDAVDISCDVNAITDAQMNNVVLGYAYMAQNFSALSSSQIGNSSSTTISDSIAVCTNIAGASCTNTDPALISSQIRDTMRDLMNTTQYGVGTFDASNPALIPVACP